MTHKHIHTVLNCLSNPVRLEILLALMEEELCVNDLVARSGREQSLTSYHLRRLRNCGLVSNRHEAQKSLYSLSGPSVRWVLTALQDASRELEPLCKDPTCGGGG